jgi:hypothetical protein
MVDTGLHAVPLRRRPGQQTRLPGHRGRAPRRAIALRASCDALRSTVGKGQPGTPIPVSAQVSVLEWIGHARARQADAEAELTAAVARARQPGRSWTAIATRLGTARQVSCHR